MAERQSSDQSGEEIGHCMDVVNQAGACPVCGESYDHTFDGLHESGDSPTNYVHKDPDQPYRTLKMCERADRPLRAETERGEA